MPRWRGRIASLAIVATFLGGLAALAVGATTGSRPSTGAASWQITVRDSAGEVLFRAPLPNDRFVLRYRHSVYRSVAEERFAVTQDGRLVLVELAADEAAVLDEYYAVGRRPSPADSRDPRRWQAPPAAALSLDELAVAATAHGRRTLVIEGRAIPLWRVVDAGDVTVILAAEPMR